MLESIQLVGNNYQFNQKWFWYPDRWFKSKAQLLPEIQSVLYQAVEKSREKSSFEDHQDEVNSVAISHDGNYLVSGSKDKTIKLPIKVLIMRRPSHNEHARPLEQGDQFNPQT